MSKNENIDAYYITQKCGFYDSIGNLEIEYARKMEITVYNYHLTYLVVGLFGFEV